MNKAERLGNIIRSERTILVPGVYDCLSAKIFAQSGFEVLYMSGSGVTASLLGMPDVGLLTMTEMVNTARNIIMATDLPLICDADTGYGNPINVIRTVREYEHAGAAGIHIEDQVAPKKCGHFQGKEIVSASEMIRKIEAAIHARVDKNFLIIARTDACSVSGTKEALQRARVYAKAGADMIFVEAPGSEEDLKRVAEHLSDIPLLVNMVEGGRTPLIPFEKLSDMGFKIVLYPTSSIRAVAKTLQDLGTHLYANKGTREFEERLVSFNGRNKITGLEEIIELEKRFE